MYDDKYQLNSTIKTVILLSIIFFFVYHGNKFQIYEIRSSLFGKTIQLENFAIFFTSICIFSFLVASNMFDGSNGQSFINFLSIFVFLTFKGLFLELSYLFSLMLIFFAFYNFKNLAYLGDNGVYFSFILSYLVIQNYNFDKNIYVEEIIIVYLFQYWIWLDYLLQEQFWVKSFYVDTTHLHHMIQKIWSGQTNIYFSCIVFCSIIYFAFFKYRTFLYNINLIFCLCI